VRETAIKHVGIALDFKNPSKIAETGVPRCYPTSPEDPSTRLIRAAATMDGGLGKAISCLP